MRATKKSKVIMDKKTKPCFVRLEKVRSSKLLRSAATSRNTTVTKSTPAQSYEEKINKKLTGPLKKRPIVNTSVATPNVHQQRRVVPSVSKKPNIEEPVQSVAEGRSRRAPKPNPKYNNNEIVTPKNKFHSNISEDSGSVTASKPIKKNGQLTSDSSDSEDLYHRDDSSLNLTSDDEDNYFEIDSESDFETMKIQLQQKKQNRSKRPADNFMPQEKLLSPPTFLPNSRQTVPQQIIIKKATPTPAPIVRPSPATSKVRPSSSTPFDSSSSTSDVLSRKRKINQTDFEREREREITAARNKRMNIALYDSSSTKQQTVTPHRTSASTLTAKSQTQNNFRKIVPSFLANKMTLTNQGKNTSPSPLTSTSRASSPLITKKSTTESPLISRKSSIARAESPLISRKTVPNSVNTKVLAPEKSSNVKLGLRHLPIKTPAKTILSTKPDIKTPLASSAPTATSVLSKPKDTTLPSRSTDKKPSTEKSSPASTQDDFEIMPTFTIVNINDIINKKGDVLTPTKQNDDMSKSNSNEDREKSPASITPPLSPVPVANKQIRRKPTNSSILSEKIDPAKLKSVLPRTPLPPTKKQPQTILNHTLANRTVSVRGRQSLTGPSKTKFVEKPAPRILNSVVAKKTLPVQPMISKCSDPDDPDDPDSIDDNFSFFDDDDDDDDDETERYHSPVKSESKANTNKKVVTNNNNKILAKENTKQLTSVTTKQIHRKLPPEKVVVSREGNKLIKKITCFETWYVINIPDDKTAEVVRNSLELPLTKLANDVNSVKLPSSSWSNKVNLSQVSPQMVGKGSLIKYTGDLLDQSISEKDRNKYQPLSVMFRRTAQEKSKTRFPYDRAVIFKNKTFYTNIDGKNVKLVGAPTNISSLEEIEVLLELIDELNLRSSFVEPSSTI